MKFKYFPKTFLSAIMAIGCLPNISVAADIYPYAGYPVTERYSGPKHFPDFLRRDHDYAEFRTRILDQLRQSKAPGFAGKYALVTIGCGTDCTFGYLVDLSTGKVRDLPRQGEEFMDLRYDARVDSALLVARWRSLETSRCYDEQFVWMADHFEKIGKRDVGDVDTCLAPWPTK